MKLASVTVLYNTTEEELLDNLVSYADLVDVLILWDNTPSPNDLERIVQRWSATILIQNGENVGLGDAYNRAYDIAKRYDCTHLMTMDQDTKFIDFGKFRKWAENQSDNILHCQVGGYHNSDNETEVMDVWCQSATIFPLAMLDKIGLFRSDYFIGMIDAEIGLRAAHAGYCVIQYNGTNAQHNLTQPATGKLFGHTVHLYNYSPFRHYYESRNRILIAKEYPSDFDKRYISRFVIARLKLIVKILLFENNKACKTGAIISGTFNGLLKKAVPYNHFKQ